MLKKILIGLMILTVSSIFAQMNNYKMELIHTFSKGRDPGDIMAYYDAQDTNPASFYFDNNGHIYVADSIFLRIVKYDKDFNFIEDYKKMDSSRYEKIIVKDNFVYASTYDYIIIETLKGELIVDIRRSKIFNDKLFNRYFLYENGIVTITTTDGAVYKIEKPSSDPESNIVIQIEESYEKRALNKIIQTSSRDLFSNFKEFRDKVDKQEAKKDNTLISSTRSLNSITLREPVTMKYLGSDKDGNIYWNDSYLNIVIFNSSYEFIDAFTFDVPNVQIVPVIHPDGDVYFMDITKERAELLRVKRVW